MQQIQHTLDDITTSQINKNNNYGFCTNQQKLHFFGQIKNREKYTA